jgi:hypothetical protein
MAERGFATNWACNTEIGVPANVNCYYQPYSTLLDRIWRTDLTAEQAEDLRIALKKAKQ